jgi:hypothetical protein
MDVKRVIDILEYRRRYNRAIADTLTPRKLQTEQDVVTAQVAFQIAAECEALIAELRSSPTTKQTMS